jgi:hypothetical protein
MRIKSRILQALTFIEKKAKTARTELSAKDECLRKLDIAKNAFELIIHTTHNVPEPESKDSDYIKSLKAIAIEALKKIN